MDFQVVIHALVLIIQRYKSNLAAKERTEEDQNIILTNYEDDQNIIPKNTDNYRYETSKYRTYF